MDLNLSTGQSIPLEREWSPSIQAPRKLTVRPIRDVHVGDRVFSNLVKTIALSVGLLLILIGLFLALASWPAIKTFGIQFLFSSDWDPVRESYGALPVIYGTIVSSFLALFLATPLSVGIALFINELAPRRLGKIVGFLVEMLAAIPSVVYGLWGIFILAPWLRVNFQPFLIEHLGWMPFFQGPAYGVGMFTASLILAIMITPTISSIAREVFRTIEANQKEAALALGATRWEMMKLSILRSTKAGVMGAVVLGLGRALGETMAVTMVIGNRAKIAASLFAPAQTMASVIANEYAEATSDIHLSALAEIGLVLFGVTFVVNGLARFIIWRVSRVKGAH